jgi:hypothetical protein
MSITFIILLVLICQVWLLSYFYPKQVVKRINYVLTHCPENDYPKLYFVSSERIITIKHTYQILNYVLIFIGLGLIFYFSFIVSDYNKYINILDDLPLLFGIAQFVPLFILEILGYKHLKLMRQQQTQTTRKAELQPRHLFNFIPRYQVILAVLTYVSFIIYELVISNFTLNTDAVIKIGTVTMVNIMFTAIGMANLYGKKRDPYQENNERNKQTKFVLQSLLFISIFMTIYLMVHSWVNMYELNYVEVLIDSLYFQILALFSIGALIGRNKIDDMNFDVYKADSIV